VKEGKKKEELKAVAEEMKVASRWFTFPALDRVCESRLYSLLKN